MNISLTVHFVKNIENNEFGRTAVAIVYDFVEKSDSETQPAVVLLTA